jgi:hypothetical protein
MRSLAAWPSGGWIGEICQSWNPRISRYVPCGGRSTARLLQPVSGSSQIRTLCLLHLLYLPRQTANLKVLKNYQTDQ